MCLISKFNLNSHSNNTAPTQARVEGFHSINSWLCTLIALRLGTSHVSSATILVLTYFEDSQFFHACFL